MKRHGNLFGEIIDMGNLRQAYRRAAKGKTWQRKVQLFSQDLESNLETIRESLVNKTFITAAYRIKTIYEPKTRQIYILPFAPDRIVQHALMAVLEPIWDKLFIDESYSCRVGKGIHAGSRRTMEHVRQYKYCLKCDVAKFYPNIDHDILHRIVKQKIKCPETLWLLKQIIYSVPGGKNCPIGNYTSQWFGNLYLNELDMLMKHKYKIKAYVRYCDDFLLFDNDKKHLGRMAKVIGKYFADYLKFTLSKCDLFPVSRGVDFLGYRHFPKYILLRKTTAKRVVRRLKKLPELLRDGRITQEQFRSSIASTKGWLRWANTHNLTLKLQLSELEGMICANS